MTEVPMSPTQLVVIAGPETGKVLILREGSGHQMGRHENTAYTLSRDPRISRFHCEVQFNDGEVIVIDRGGSGGVLVNGFKIDSKKLKHGDVIQVGDSQLRLHTATGSDETTLARSGPAEADPMAVERLAD